MTRINVENIIELAKRDLIDLDILDQLTNNEIEELRKEIDSMAIEDLRLLAERYSVDVCSKLEALQRIYKLMQFADCGRDPFFFLVKECIGPLFANAVLLSTMYIEDPEPDQYIDLVSIELGCKNSLL